MQNGRISDLVLGVSFGLAAGCLFGVLYAPQAGRRTRRHVVSALRDGIDQVKSQVEDTGKYVRDKGSRLQSDARDLVDRGKAAMERGQAQIESLIEAGTKMYLAAAR